MKKLIITTLTLCLSIISYSQIKFEPGYFIDNNSNRTDCLIRNTNPKNNPSSFKYKLIESSEIKIKTIESIQEFSINNTVKYIRQIVNIDRTGYDIASTTYNISPKFTLDTIFLKVLLEGKASLYSYIEGPIERFFYSVDHSSISQLIYKQYLVPGKKTRYNCSFRSQLFEDLQNDSLSYHDIEDLKYTQSDLNSHFIKYNKCHDSDYIYFNENSNKGILSFSIKAGINYSSFWIDNVESDLRDADFGTKWHPRIGFKFEYLIPYRSNKWALFSDPNYYYNSGEQKIDRGTAQAVYQAIEIPLGLRHYFYLNEKSKIFISGSGVFLAQINSQINFDEVIMPLGILSSLRAKVGLGYTYKDKYSVELNYCNNRNFTQGFLWTSEYKYLALILGYTITNNKP